MQKKILIAIFSFLLTISCSLSPQQTISQEQLNKLNSILESVYKGNFGEAQTALLPFKKEKINNSLYFFLAGLTEEKVNKNLKTSTKMYKKGLTLLSKQKKADPFLEAMLYFYLSYDYSQLKDSKHSESYINSALDLLETLEKQNKLKSGIGYYFLGYCYNKHKNPELAIRFYFKAIDWLSKNHHDYFYLAGAYFNIGLIYYNQSDLTNAVKYWEKAYSIEPSSGYYKNVYYQWLVITQESLKNKN